jgi:hypothetical protein
MVSLRLELAAPVAGRVKALASLGMRSLETFLVHQPLIRD